MTHRNRIHQAKGVPFNQIMLKAIGYTTLTCVVIGAIVQVIAHADEIDNNSKMAFNVLGVMFLATVGVYWLYKKVTGRI